MPKPISGDPSVLTWDEMRARVLADLARYPTTAIASHFPTEDQDKVRHEGARFSADLAKLGIATKSVEIERSVLYDKSTFVLVNLERRAPAPTSPTTTTPTPDPVPPTTDRQPDQLTFDEARDKILAECAQHGRASVFTHVATGSVKTARADAIFYVNSSLPPGYVIEDFVATASVKYPGHALVCWDVAVKS